MRETLAPDGPVMQFFSHCLDLIIVSILFSISCIPVITIGCALSSAYYAIVKAVRQGEGHVVKAYFHSFGQNWKQGLGLGILFDVVLAALFLNVWVILRNNMGNAGIVFGAVFGAMLLIVFILMSYCFPILSRFECHWAGLLQTGVQFALCYGGKTVQLLVMEIVLIGGMVAGMLLMPVLVLILPGLIIFAQSQILEPLFVQYMPEGGEEHGTETI